MVSRASPSPILFILCVAKPFLCSPSALRGREVWWYRLSRQKWTNVERELSSMRKETWNDQVDRQKTAFCSLTTDDIAHNCKSGNSPRDHFLPLKPFDSL